MNRDVPGFVDLADPLNADNSCPVGWPPSESAPLSLSPLDIHLRLIIHLGCVAHYHLLLGLHLAGNHFRHGTIGNPQHDALFDGLPVGSEDKNPS